MPPLQTPLKPLPSPTTAAHVVRHLTVLALTVASLGNPSRTEPGLLLRGVAAVVVYTGLLPPLFVILVYFFTLSTASFSPSSAHPSITSPPRHLHNGHNPSSLLSRRKRRTRVPLSISSSPGLCPSDAVDDDDPQAGTSDRIQHDDVQEAPRLDRQHPVRGVAAHALDHHPPLARRVAPPRRVGHGVCLWPPPHHARREPPLAAVGAVRAVRKGRPRIRLQVLGVAQRLHRRPERPQHRRVAHVRGLPVAGLEARRQQVDGCRCEEDAQWP